MAPGIAHRREQAAGFVLNVYDVKSPRQKRRKVGRKRGRKRKRPEGPLRDMPVEILQQILFDVDLASLGTVRCVNSHFRAVVDGLSTLRTLRRHAAQTLRVMSTLTSNITSAFSLRQLWAEFTQPTCRGSGCSAFGPYVFLPTLRRCCYRCLTHQREFQVSSISLASFRFGVTRRSIVSQPDLPFIHRPPGNYGDPWNWLKIPEYEDLVSIKQAENLGAAHYGSRQAMIEAVEAKRADEKAKYERGMEEWHRRCRQGLAARPPRQLIGTNPLTTNYLSEWRCQGATALPFFDMHTQSSEPGVYCSACDVPTPGTGNSDPSDFTDDDGEAVAADKHRVRRNRAFTLDTIREHFDHCWRQRGFGLKHRFTTAPSGNRARDFLVDEVKEAQ